MAHEECNSLRCRQNTINIYCHNGSAFDFHFLVCEKFDDERIKYIDGLPDSQERLRLIHLNEYVFKDSIKFLKNSLDCLIKDSSETLITHSRYFHNLIYVYLMVCLTMKNLKCWRTGNPEYLTRNWQYRTYSKQLKFQKKPIIIRR